MSIIENRCLACNKTFKGRSDKKFCDDQCRSMYHNRHRPFHEQTIQNTNKALRKNRSLLAHFCPSGKSTVEKKVLMKLDFRFELFTNIFPFTTGVYFFCYDYGYLPIVEKDIEKMLIVQKQDYMDTLDFSPWKIQIKKH